MEVNRPLQAEERCGSIQVLRGLAIIAVVLIHNTPAGLPQVFVRPFLNYSVALFLFLSGLLSHAQNRTPWKRIKKVIVPYIVWTLIYTVLRNIGSIPMIPGSFLKNVLTAGAADPLYYVFVYCEFTLLLPLIDKMARTKFKYFGFIIAPVEIICMRTLPLITGHVQTGEWLETVMSISCLGWFTFFYLGYLMGNRLIAVKKRPGLWMGLLVVSILLQIAEGYWQYTKGITNCGTQLKLSAVFTNVCFLMLAYQFIERENKRECRVLRVLGDDSFAIYLSHVAVMQLLSQLPFYDQFVVYPLNAVCTIALDMLFIYVGRRILKEYGRYLAL